MKKTVITIMLIISVLIFAGGCQVAGIMTSPTRHERKIPAEFDLASHLDEKILVVVDSADWSNVPVDLKQKLTKALNVSLAERLELDKENIIDYKNEKDFLAGEDKTSPKLAFNIGKKAGADFVLFIGLYDFDISTITETDYYKAEISGKAALFDINETMKVWPKEEKGKFIRVGFDVEQGGYSGVTRRLAGSFAHCTVRYLYDCPVANFKHFDDRTLNQLQQWDDMF